MKIIFIQMSLKFVPNGPFDNKSALVPTMDRRQIGNKPLFEPMMTQFTEAFKCRHWLSLRKTFLAASPIRLVSDHAH